MRLINGGAVIGGMTVYDDSGNITHDWGAARLVTSSAESRTECTDMILIILTCS